MPSRPPIDMGRMNPDQVRAEGRGDKSKMWDRQTGAPTSENSKTAVETELRIAGTDEVLTLPAMVCSTVWDIKLVLAERLGIEPGDMTFIMKQGPYWKENKNSDEVRRKVIVKGIKSFQRAKMQHPHPIAVIGAGHIGLRQAMIFMKYDEYNFVIFDRKPKVGGISWWDQANTTSKLQTELGVYHLGWDETLPVGTIPGTKGGNDYPWPSRDELLVMFDESAREFGIMPYVRLSTDVKEMKIEGQRADATYELTIQSLADKNAKEESFMSSAVMLYPGNLSLPRRENYKGEEDFGGVIAYGMFDEFGYKEATGKDIAIIGHGAFAVENVRTCCEYDCNQIYLVCRRKNIACPRFVSWMANQSASPLSAALFLNSAKPMYDLVGFDVWTYYAVQSNEKRTACSIQQKARFGIGDVYFCAISWGKLEVIEDPLGIKRLSHHALYCGSGRKIEVQCVLKLLGFVGNPENDRLMKCKELVGYWVNDDPKRYIVAEPVSVMATNFGGTSFSPGAISWAEMGMWFIHYPKDWWDRVLPSGMMPRHKADESDEQSIRPAYVVDARHGTSTAIFIGAAIPFLAERGGIASYIKCERMWALHPVDKFIQYCKEDWDHYCNKFRAEGRSGPEYPYTRDVALKYVNTYRGENTTALKEVNPKLLECYEGLVKPSL
eukprot:TRINITY_DN64364_c0_g1_i1.p1 TRINITY_DN64364_c0_g1~~TRINITY_DN64364_c0_g1_i1.p1  ORF type:complete len:664 (+),score=135.93 TRINITY_DN64364_c0_g1_i1:31-2022(+)